jgi:hypothetical protein
MTTQLVLVDEAPEWRLDERTRSTGRRGVAQAREALRAAAAEALQRPSTTSDPAQAA